MHWMVVSTVDEGQTIVDRLSEGEPFEELAQEFVPNPLFADENGEVGWVPVGAFPELDDVLFSAQIDAIIGPVQTLFGVIVARVTQGPEEQELSTVMRTVLGDLEAQRWAQQQVGALLRDFDFDRDDFVWVVEHLH